MRARASQSRPADAPDRDWIDRFTPARAQPYLRLMRADRPIGVWLLLLPCWMGMALAALAGASIDGWLTKAGLFALGAVVMRGAGCVYNDIVDRDIDARVARTAGRPIASGQISRRAAAMFGLALTMIGLAVLIQFNPFTIALGAASLALVGAYPFMKRITWWPQAFLGLTFNWGALVGYSAMTGALSIAAVTLYAAAILWTIGYDTIYAHQDKEDDALIGVKSSALRLGGRTRPALAFFYAGALALFWVSVILAGGPWLALLAFIPAALQFGWQVYALKIDNPSRCLTIFKSNREAGLLILAGIFTAFQMTL